MQKIITASDIETKKFARDFLPNFDKNVVLLRGELGSGKTVFVKGAAEVLGITEVVNSPTYVIMKIYKIKNKSKWQYLVHADLYRLEKVTGIDLQNLGLAEHIADPASLVMIEWPERCLTLLKRYPQLKFGVRGENQREIILS